VVVFPSALVLMRRTWFSRARALDLAAAAGVFAILALPILGPQARITSDYHRSAETIESLSADTADFLRLPEGSAGSHLVPWVQDPRDGHALYPGSVLVVLAIAARWWRRAGPPPTPRPPTGTGRRRSCSWG
jgi:hypothetical protein